MSMIAVLVADKTHARFFLKSALNGKLEEIEGWANSQGRLRDRELVSSRPGRSFDSLGCGRHAMEPRTHAKKHLADEFARFIATDLQQEEAQKKFEKLVIMAGPEFLGLVRQHLSPTLKHKLLSEIDKNAILDDIDTLDLRVRKLMLP